VNYLEFTCCRLGSSVVAPGKRAPVLKQVVQKGETGFALVFEHYALVREGREVGERLQPPATGPADLLSPITSQVSSYTSWQCC